jgi:hypothetical protein
VSAADARIRAARTYTLQRWAAQADNGAARWRRQVPTGYLAAAMSTYLETRAAILAELERRGAPPVGGAW